MTVLRPTGRMVGALFALMLFAPAAPQPVRADIAQCVGGWAKTALDPEAIKDAVEFLANHGQCVPLIADPSGQFAAITSALVGAKKANQFSSVGQCQNKIPTLLADVAVKVSDSVGDAIGFKIPNAIKSKGKQAIVDWINSSANSNPVLASIKAQMDCGCAVATYGTDKFEQVINDVVDTAEACAGVIGDVAKMGEAVVGAIAEGLEDAAEDLEKIGGALVDLMEDCLSASAGQKSVMDCLSELPELAGALGSLLGSAASIGEDFLSALGSVAGWAKPACCATIGQFWGDACGGCSPPSKPKPPQVDLNCQGVICAKDMQCGGPLNDRCVPCAETLNYAAHGKTAGMCECNKGYTSTYKQTAGGPVLTACSCGPPLVIQPILVASVCTCPVKGQVVQYKGGNSFCDCKWGESLKSGKCQPIKCPGATAIAADGKTCVQFEPISLKDQPTPVMQAKPVLPCPPNYKWDGAKCIYSGPLSIDDKAKAPLQALPGGTPCPPDHAWDGRRCAPVPGARKGTTVKLVPTVPPCPGGQVWDGAKCAPQAPQRAIRAVPVVPTCPADTTWNGTTCAPKAVTRAIKALAPLVPACPANTRWDGKRCVPVPPPVLPVVPRTVTPTPR